MGDKLVGATVLVYDAALPGKEFRDQVALKGFILGGETAVDGAADVGQIVPGAQSVAPIGQPKGGIESLYSAEFFLKPFLEQSLGAGGTGVVGLCLIVQLEANHVLIGHGCLQKPSDDNFTVAAVAGVREIHQLTVAVAARAVMGLGQNIGVLPSQPGGDRVGRCADDDLNVMAAGSLQYSV